MTKPFDPTKPVQTRDGRKARIICTDMKASDCTIVALIDNGYIETPAVYTKSGGYCSGVIESDSDLINTPERMSRWSVAVNAVSIGGFSSKELATKACNSYIDACPVEIIFENGKPVDVKLHKDEK